MENEHIPLAVRACPKPKDRKAGNAFGAPTEERWTKHVLVLDTETSIDTSQRLLLGSYRVYTWEGLHLVCLEEGIFYGDDLPKYDPEGLATLQAYAASRSADVGPGVPKRLKLLSRTEFVDTVFWQMAYKARALVVGFNLPFDLSRLAVEASRARNSFRGGFSLELWRRPGRTQRGDPQPYRPRLRIQHVDSKRSFMRFGRPKKIDAIDQRPGDGLPPDPGYAFPGHFLDLRTLAFALTGDSHTLDSACAALGVPERKQEAQEHGVIREDYIAYNRQDVRATAALLEALRAEYDRHPIDLPPTRAFSPASVAKAYYRAMGLAPPRKQFRKLTPEILGYAMSAFFGGRTECRIRKAAVPVVYTDFLSMYPTVQCLMDLWGLLTAESVRPVSATREVRRLLRDVSLEGCFEPESWKELRGFALVEPEGDILPARARYQGSEWTIGVNPLHAKEPLWYALPDLVASVLLTGKVPKVIRAFRLAPEGSQDLQAVRLRGEVKVDPRQDNFFRAVIEARQRVKRDDSLPAMERNATQHFLKTLANAGSYGLFAEMNRKPTRKDRKKDIWIYGRKGRFPFRTDAPEEPGVFACPPIAALITAGARLMLAMLERCVSDQGGAYAFADTDSMAIVASREGGLVACPGGPESLPEGSEAIRALSWAEVGGIVERFEALNPYDRRAVPGSILKVEDVNFDTQRKQREIQAYAISSKRYALFSLDREGNPVIHECSEHGLGQYLNPSNPESEDRDWIRAVWEEIVLEAVGGAALDLPWLDVPAMMRSSVSNPDLLDRFDGLNRRKRYSNRIKPFNFLLSAVVDPLERPASESSSARSFNLIAPSSRNPSDWLKSWWIDLHSGERFRIRSRGHTSGNRARVQTLRDVIARFRNHPESKSADAAGEPAGPHTIGLLARRSIRASLVLHIGKETNLLEEQEEGVLEVNPQAVYVGEDDQEMFREWLGTVSIPELSKATGISERMLRAIRSGERNASRLVLKTISSSE